jgi:hypothetical protein
VLFSTYLCDHAHGTLRLLDVREMCSDRYLLETCLVGQVGGLVVQRRRGGFRVTFTAVACERRAALRP